MFLTQQAYSCMSVSSPLSVTSFCCMTLHVAGISR